MKEGEPAWVNLYWRDRQHNREPCFCPYLRLSTCLSVCLHVCASKLNKQDFQHREEEGHSNNTHTPQPQEIKVSVTIVCVCVCQRDTEEVLYLHYPLVHHNLSHFILDGGYDKKKVFLYCSKLSHCNKEASVVRLIVLFVLI